MQDQITRAPSAPIPELPLRGFRNYWYPAMFSHRLRRRPVAVRLLGEDVVLFRAGDEVAALVDRCAHRGARLSLGRVVFPGTLSCGYHGWTYNRHGECVAAIVEGPESKIPGKVGVPTYPVQERHGLIWVFLGDGEAPPLEEDLPLELCEPNVLVQSVFFDWPCNWRNATENFPDMLHTIFVHRTSIMHFFQRMGAWGELGVEPLEDGKGLRVHAGGGAMQAEYPGLGKFPARYWWRLIRPRAAAYHWSDVRMPGYILVRRREPFLGFRMAALQWPVPVDEDNTKVLSMTIVRARNIFERAALKLWFNSYYRPVQRQFINQDKRLIRSQSYRDPEKLSITDVGVIQWRRLAAANARQPRSERRGPTLAPAGESNAVEQPAEEPAQLARA